MKFLMWNINCIFAQFHNDLITQLQINNIQNKIIFRNVLDILRIPNQVPMLNFFCPSFMNFCDKLECFSLVNFSILV